MTIFYPWMPVDFAWPQAILLGHISSSISYFGSATLIVLAGLVGALVNINHIYIMSRELKSLSPMNADLFTFYFALLALILALGVFAFTYALLGGLQSTPVHTPETRIMGEQAAVVLTEAVRSINNGIRAFYYAIAALFLFAGPYICIAATLAITGVLYYRQVFSPTARAIGRYVEALKRIKE